MGAAIWTCNKGTTINQFQWSWYRPWSQARFTKCSRNLSFYSCSTIKGRLSTVEFSPHAPHSDLQRNNCFSFTVSVSKNEPKFKDFEKLFGVKESRNNFFSTLIRTKESRNSLFDSLIRTSESRINFWIKNQQWIVKQVFGITGSNQWIKKQSFRANDS